MAIIKKKFASYLVITTVGIVVVAILVIAVPVAASEEGKAIFEEKCQVCHSIGEGVRLGPDLKDVSFRMDRQEIISFILDPEESGQGMPDLGLSGLDAGNVLDYIDSQSALMPALISEEEENPQPVLISDGDIAAGRDIFVGKTRLENNGAACFSCHNIDGLASLGGGAFAKDLTGNYAELTPDGLIAISQAMPVMADIYTERPLTEEEIAQLTAFIRDASASVTTSSSPPPLVFIVIGVAGYLVIIGLLQLVWGGRLSGVRQSLVDKGGSK